MYTKIQNNLGLFYGRGSGYRLIHKSQLCTHSNKVNENGSSRPKVQRKKEKANDGNSLQEKQCPWPLNIKNTPLR